MKERSLHCEEGTDQSSHKPELRGDNTRMTNKLNQSPTTEIERQDRGLTTVTTVQLQKLRDRGLTKVQWVVNIRPPNSTSRQKG